MKNSDGEGSAVAFALIVTENTDCAKLKEYAVVTPETLIGAGRMKASAALVPVDVPIEVDERSVDIGVFDSAPLTELESMVLGVSPGLSW